MGDGRRWTMLALGTAAQTAACCLMFGLPFLLPYLRRVDRLSLAQAGALVAAPSIGLVLTLIGWGVLADRVGERVVLGVGLGLTGVFALVGALLHAPLALGVGFALVGAAGASVSAGSGRLVMGWFGVRQRGLAMGIRQMGQPLGVAFAALVLPPLAERGGLVLALLAPALVCLVVAALVSALAADPPARPAPADRRARPEPADRRSRPEPADRRASDRPRSPYRAAALWRVHAASSLLVVPQFATATFSAEYLVAERHWDPSGAGRVLAVVALAGALGRLLAGRWSDVVGSRLRPMRQVAVLSAAAMLLVGLAVRTGSGWVVLALAVASVVSVSDNGLGFTATAELAGRDWSGRALGAQNTAQNLAAFATGPLIGVLAGTRGFATAFAACAAFPLLATVVTPVRAEQSARPEAAAGQPVAG